MNLAPKAPVIQNPKKLKKPVKKQPKKVESSSDSSDSDSESEKVVKKQPKKQPKKVESSSESSSDSDSESEEVVKKTSRKASSKKSSRKASVKKVESDSESEEEIVKHTPKKVVQEENTSDCKELFLKNLSWNTDENVLTQHFSTYGEVVNVKVLYDRNTGKARGLGFVEFSTRAEAQAALDAPQNVDGRDLTMSFSDNKPQRPAGNGFGSNQGSAQRGAFNKPNYTGDRHTIFVGNLGFRTQENAVAQFFGQVGTVVDVRIAKNEEGRAKGFAHVDFDSAEAVQSAMGLAGQQLDGREIRVDASTPRQGGGQRGGARGGRGGFRGGRGGNFNPMDKAKKSGAMLQPSSNAVVTFDDDE